MFTIKANPTFEATVKIPSPTGAQEMVMIFKHKKRTELRAYFEKVAASEGDTAVKDLMEIVEGWTGVDVPFSEQALGELIENFYGAVPAIFDSYVATLGQSSTKN